MPYQKLPVHDHPATPTLYVYLSDSGPVRFSHIEKEAFSIVRPLEKAGMFRLSPGRIEKHEVENLGDIISEFLRVELKRVPLGFQSHDFRDRKPIDLTHTGVLTEFSGAYVRIERIIAAPGGTVEAAKLDQPSLLIACMKAGEVRWIGAHDGYKLTASSTEPAHALRIVFLSP